MTAPQPGDVWRWPNNDFAVVSFRMFGAGSKTQMFTGHGVPLTLDSPDFTTAVLVLRDGKPVGGDPE